MMLASTKEKPYPIFRLQSDPKTGAAPFVADEEVHHGD